CSAGGGLGYQGVANSVAIEFDSYNNGEVGASNHVGIDVNGSLASLSPVSPYGISGCTGGNYGATGCMSNGKIWSAFVNYDGTTQKLNVSVQEAGSALIQLITDFNIDIATALGTNDAFVGFTAATGSGWQNHDILNWQLANDTSIVGPGRLPEPADLALLSLAGVAALFASRRRRA
ncbi:MAG: PEP-CTERM sorting domain-containing protein, partial [Rubrivivax sp.]